LFVPVVNQVYQPIVVKAPMTTVAEKTAMFNGPEIEIETDHKVKS